MKNLKKLGKTLNKAEQQSINGGRFVGCQNLNRCFPISAGTGFYEGAPCSSYWPTYNITCSNGSYQNGQCCFTS